MPASPTGSGLRKYLAFRPLLWLLLGLVVLRGALGWAGLDERILTADSDDLLRMVMVRDWLAGQSWFDTQQYRILPPEGISIHWSRYIDAALGGIIWLGGLWVAMPVAEQIAMVIWPTLLLCLLLALNGVAALRISGPEAAVGAMLAVFLWPKIAGFEFAVGRVDHHNVQILCISVLAFAMIWPAASARGQFLAAIAGGLAAAVSLAVGLEMLPVLLIIWAMAGLRFAFEAPGEVPGEVPGAGRWLAVFAVTLGLAAPLLMAGQVPVAVWVRPYCDALAPPVLSLLLIGVVVSVVPVLLARRLSGRLSGRWSRITLMAVLLLAGFGLAWPLLGPCISGPYGALSDEARAIIATRIGETQSAFLLAIRKGAGFDFNFLYSWILLPVATGFALFARRRLGPAERQGLVLMLVIGWVGVLGAMDQIRAATLGTPAIPFLTGFVLKELIVLGRAGAQRVAALAIMAGFALLAWPVEVMQPIRAALTTKAAPQAAGAAIPAVSGETCRSEAAFQALNAVPPALMATTINMGVRVLYFTPHSVTSAPYHRSSDAFANGEAPFRDPEAMLAMLRRSGAGYVILCASQDYAKEDMGFASELQSGTLPPWLRRVDLPGQGQGQGQGGALILLQLTEPLPGAAP
ncbi:hypothetical protein [Pseudogemmobacter bohemicus]|uniref:hypothetical protein n=1 Tax=Pseudogemmobacter bohemicus TaxID=2250708 RepID=UPI000DD312D8|nr:hypothetical protein [Pseudogemmobacter bohemicus]